MRRFLGFSEDWREDGTGAREFYVLWVCVYRSSFWHSTTFLD